MKLTPKLFKVFILSKKGLDKKQIGQKLGLPYRTIETYFCSIYRQLGVNSKKEMMQVPIYLLEVEDLRGRKK